MKQGANPLEASVAEVLSGWGIDGTIDPNLIANLVFEGAAYWQTELPDGSALHLLRVHAPLVQREEVFLGNVLLNDFLFRTAHRCLKQLGANTSVWLANDLESAYFLARGAFDFAELGELYRQDIAAAVPDLYLGGEDRGRGIHGWPRRLLTYTKSDFEPFPVYCIPRFLARETERRIRDWLQDLLNSTDFQMKLKTIMASLAFFYGQKGGGSGDTQSFEMFLDRLVNHYKVLEESSVKTVFGLTEISKPAIKQAVAGGQFEPDALRQLLLNIAKDLWRRIDNGDDRWLMRFILDDEKLIDIDEGTFVSEILASTEVGSIAFQLTKTESIAPCCPLCGRSLPRVRESYVTVGLNKSRFKTRNSKRDRARHEAVLCGKCALCIYLSDRVLGTRDVVWQKQPRKTAQMPSSCNVVLHYGTHKDVDVAVLERQVDAVLAAARDQAKTLDEIWRDLAQIRKEVQAELLVPTAVPNEEIEHAFLAGLEEWVPPALEVAAQMQTDVQARVLPIGTGINRLLVFVLPQLQPGQQEGIDYVQQRFSRSRLAAFTLLALLRGLCNCEGPYYYQSLPTLSAEGMSTDTFYVRNRPERASEALRLYGVVTDFAKRVVRHRKGHSPLSDWILISERILADPLAVFSEVLRQSPLRAGDDFNAFRYQRLSHTFIPGMHVVDSTDYIALFRKLQHLEAATHEGGKTMPRQLNVGELDQFCNLLFGALDRLGGDLLPLRLTERPTAFEKYPRLLLGSIQRYGSVEAGFDEWLTKVLRDANEHRKQEEFPELMSLRQWLVEHRALFEGNRETINHLKRSLYGRLYTYLYPRRLLCTSYAECHKGNAEALQPEVIRARFTQQVQPQIEQLSRLYCDQALVERIVADAETCLVANRKWYTWKP